MYFISWDLMFLSSFHWLIRDLYWRILFHASAMRLRIATLANETGRSLKDKILKTYSAQKPVSDSIVCFTTLSGIFVA